MLGKNSRLMYCRNWKLGNLRWEEKIWKSQQLCLKPTLKIMNSILTMKITKWTRRKERKELRRREWKETRQSRARTLMKPFLIILTASTLTQACISRTPIEHLLISRKNVKFSQCRITKVLGRLWEGSSYWQDIYKGLAQKGKSSDRLK